MVPKCPKCSTELRDDYGMVTCPSCGAIVFVDMEGLAHVASEQPEVPQAPSSIEIASNFESPIASTDAAPDISNNVSPFDLSPPDLSPENLAAPDLGSPSFPPMEVEAFGAPSTVNATEEPAGEMDMNAFLGYEPEPGAAPAGASASQNDPNDPLGISAYANSEMSAAKNGPLVVSLIISGIDAKDLRDEIRQALQDSRFGWDASALMAQVKGGVLRIDRVSPVKATIIINRIKNLSVKIRWEQNAITEIDPLEKEP